MKFKWVSFEHSKCPWLDLVRGEYLGKIDHFVKTEHRPVRLRGSDLVAPEAQVKHTEKLLAEIPTGAVLIAFDQRGKALTSEEFAKVMSRVLESGKKEAFWVTGGAFGISSEVLKRADHKLALAPFVMSHQVAETVALEQVYRALTILKGLPYHNP